MTINDLMQEALESAAWRGHDMGEFDPSFYISMCSRCGRIIQIDPEPPPNGNEIGGEALAVFCPGVED